MAIYAIKMIVKRDRTISDRTKNDRTKRDRTKRDRTKRGRTKSDKKDRKGIKVHDTETSWGPGNNHKNLRNY